MKNYNDCFNRGLFYLKYTTPSIDKMKVYLRDKGYEDDDIDVSVKKMISLGYLDDYSLAMETIRNMTNQGKGIYAIRTKLFDKRISREIIDEALDDSDILKEQKHLAVKQVKKMIVGKKLDVPLILKISRKLKYLGYSNGIIYDIESQLRSRIDDV